MEMHGHQGWWSTGEQEEFYTEIDPQAECETVQDELYTVRRLTKSLKKCFGLSFMLTLHDPADGGNQFKVEEAGDSMDKIDHDMPRNLSRMLPLSSCHLRSGSTLYSVGQTLRLMQWEIN